MTTLTPAVTVRVPVAWGEMDSFHHVNNIVYLRWFETARIEWLAKVGFATAGQGVGPILARTEIDYRSPVVWPDTVEVSVVVTAVGRTSVTLGYRVVSEAQARAVVAEGTTVIVLFDAVTKKTVPLDDALRERIGVPASS